jgi:hypothetical protein
MLSRGPMFGNVTAHARPMNKDATEAMTQNLFLQIACAASRRPNTENSKQITPVDRYGHRKYRPSIVCIRTQFQRKEKPRTKAGRLKNAPNAAITIAAHLSLVHPSIIVPLGSSLLEAGFCFV